MAKTKTSTEVKARWNKSHYKHYNINLRFDTDGELIDFVELQKANYGGTTEVFREALKRFIETYEPTDLE